MFRFAHPGFFLLLIPLGLAAWAVLSRRQGGAMLFAPTHRLPEFRGSLRTLALLLMPYAFLLGALLVIIALARPQTVFSRTTHRADAIAIAMVMDVSGSMEALDFSTGGRHVTRLEVSKEACAGFVDGRPNDLIALVTFGGYATTRMPLTLDHAALLNSLKGIQIPAQVLDQEGNVVNQDELLTAIGDALATACARLDKADIKSKIAILLSDGESNTGIIKPEAAIEAAKALGVKVYTIGIGSNSRAPFMVRDMFGRNVIQYAEIILDEELLGNIADVTGGRYFHVKDAKGMQRAMKDIDKLEKTRIEQDVYHRQNELFAYFMIPGCLLIMLAATVNTLVSRKII